MSEPTPGIHDCGADVAAYVLGALEPAEEAAFRLHLESCAVCRDEVTALERVAGVLPAAVPQYRAPDSLRREVLRTVRAEARQNRAARARRARDAGEAGHGARRRRGGRGWTPMLAGAGALAALAVVLVLVLVPGGGGGARVITAQVNVPGRAELKLAGGHAELILHGFPAAPAGEVYEVWLKRGSAAPSPTRTLFGVTAQGEADVGVSGQLKGVTLIMVTPEHAGGSLVPTHPAVLVARLD